ncbi:probable WRKY transcription factor protein 1 [Telopea speciosissima]|uniref:probable WRKY transcription factor protein 1 n=1 Tax=Telopea speciosissima TaxID=54955 RepID=UPI001CC80124|nr:probable WRKY transcription factor protein 1 [Telopea speciosissima]
MCLRPPRKEDCLPKWDNSVVPFPNHDNKKDDEPTSPRVGCMGQIKRDRKLVSGFPINHHRFNNNNNNNNSSSSSNNNSDNKKYFKLNKVFSGKNLNSFLSINLSSSSSSARSSNFSKKQMMMIKGVNRIKSSYDEMDYVSFSVVDLDPPLPVIKPTTTTTMCAVNLWKRRCGGDQTLKSLQLQQINPSSVLGPNTL